MSIHVMSWVFLHSDAKLGNRLVLLALADYAHDDGSKAFPAVASLAQKARMSERAVQYALRALEQDGAIEQMGVTRTGTKIYRVLMGGAKSAGVQNPDRGGAKSAPNPSKDPLDPPGVESARASTRLKISGKPVKRDLWALTEAVLREFNGQAGKKLRLVSANGEPSEAAKRIYGRVEKYSDLKPEDHADIIRRTLASRWWGDGDVSIGVVYGPKVFEDNITRPGVPKNAKKAEKEARGDEDLAAIQRILGRTGQ